MKTRLLKKRREPPPHIAFRVARMVFGFAVLGVGLVMLVTPGQGLLAILAGLWILSADVPLARRALIRIRIVCRRARRRFRAARETRKQEKELRSGTPGEE